MDMQSFEYTGTDARGGPITGTVKALDLASAEALAKKFGCLNAEVSIYDPRASRKQAIKEPTAGSVKAPGFSAVKEARISTAVEAMASDMMLREAPAPKIEDNSRLAAMVSGMKENVERQLDAVYVRRRQSLIIGEQPVVMSNVEPLLCKQNGKILSVNMHPNHHGIMIIAVVVDHEIVKEKS